MRMNGITHIVHTFIRHLPDSTSVGLIQGSSSVFVVGNVRVPKRSVLRCVLPTQLYRLLCPFPKHYAWESEICSHHSMCHFYFYSAAKSLLLNSYYNDNRRYWFHIVQLLRKSVACDTDGSTGMIFHDFVRREVQAVHL